MKHILKLMIVTSLLFTSSAVLASEGNPELEKIANENVLVRGAHFGALEFDCETFLAAELPGRKAGTPVSQIEHALCNKQVEFLLEKRKNTVWTLTASLTAVVAVTFGINYFQARQQANRYGKMLC